MSSGSDDIVGTTPTQLFIGGTWSSSSSATTFPVDDPATGRPVAYVADATVADARSALDAACRAGSEWAATPSRYRSEILRRAFALMMERTDRLAALVTTEMGKPLGESAGEVAYAAEFLRWFAEEAVRIGGEYRTSPSGASRILTSPRPVGPCLLITPWNFPLAMLTRKIGPALAAGCTVVVKPAEQTPLSALALADLLVEAGLPAGVCNVIPTSHPEDTVSTLLDDPRLRKLSFTGSTETGRLLLRRASDHVLRTSMELGGNAPFLVLADADIDAAVSGAMVAKMRNMGESCVAANRFLVHDSVAEEFTTKLTSRMAELRMGPGTDPTSDVGPIIDTIQRDRIINLVEDARMRGAHAALGGAALDGPGFFYPPTVLVDTPGDAAINDQEIFGPVASLRSFADTGEMLAAANDTDYGLVAFLYTQSLSTALSAIDALDYGMVGINRGLVSDAAAPFGGVKNSGLGREGGREGIDEYLSLTYASIDI